MELFIAKQRSSRPITAHVLTSIVDVATAMGLNTQTCNIHLSNQAPDIPLVRRLLERLLRDAEEVRCSVARLQHLIDADQLMQSPLIPSSSASSDGASNGAH